MKAKTISFRPKREAEITRFLAKEQKRRLSPSINNTIEAIIIDFKNGVVVYEPKNERK